MVKKYLCQLISHAKNRDLGKMLGCLCLPVFWAVLGVGTLAIFLFPFVIGGLWAMLVLIGMPWMLGGWTAVAIFWCLLISFVSGLIYYDSRCGQVARNN